MRVAAQDVKPGDRVRGIGLVVEYSEPETDHLTRLEGYVSQRHEDGGQQFPVKLILPNDHAVNARRSDANFRDDQLAALEEAHTAWDEDELDDEGFVDRVSEIVWRDRNHRHLDAMVIAARVSGYAWDGGFVASTFYEHITGPQFEYTEQMQERDVEGL